jgi:hypothetical protein
MAKFNLEKYPWKATINYRQQSDLYQVGKGEQGVLICEPYKSEILPYWRFKTPAEAKQSADKIHNLFLKYLAENDFIGADMARKFLQMGFTRARRYTNYKGGKKYATDTGEQLTKGTGDPKKAISAKIFYAKWQKAEKNKIYQPLKKLWKSTHG